MPFKSKAQNAWAHTAEGTKALGGAGKVKEWEGATDYSHLPGKVGTMKYAEGGPVLKQGNDKHYKTKDRNEYGKFLSTKDRFTDGRKPAGFPEEAKTDEDWTKPAGVGRTDADDCGDTKSLKPIKPRT